MWRKVRAFLVGEPLSTKAVFHERLTNPQGLAIFGSDGLSSTAYATEEILRVAGTTVVFATLPITFAIVALIFLIAISYRQVIYAYPQGGGVYSVAKKNLGEFASLVGGSSLIIDYVLTVAVSVAAGVAAVTSVFPELYSYRVFLSVIIILVLAWANLRGVRESGKIFSLPTYFFIAAMGIMMVCGMWRYFMGTFPHSSLDVKTHIHMSEAISWFFLLHAFSAGCTALTGIEATSNGVQAFKPPESKNAARVLIWMACLLGIIFTGITLLAYWGGVVPVNEETVVSQIARSLFGRTPLYFLIQGAVALILLLASNTPFADFPRVASQLAEDGYLPRQFRNLGSRLVFANGIIALACAAIFLIYVFNGSVHALIPLYAVGVFLGFSLSQFGMVSHWRRIGDSKNRKKILLNAVGGVTTTIVLCVVFVSKFREGAWILLPSLALLFFLMKQIKSHYASVGNILALNGVPLQEIPPDKTMVILVPGFDRVTIRCVHFAQSFRPAHLRAFHVAFSVEEAEALDKKWKSYFPDVPLDIFVSEYRDLFGPVFDYLKKIEIEWSNDTVIAVMPELVPSKIWHHFLHNKTTLRLQLALEQDPEINVEILEVPFKIKV